jgi:hypothetical protein
MLSAFAFMRGVKPDAAIEMQQRTLTSTALSPIDVQCAEHTLRGFCDWAAGVQCEAAAAYQSSTSVLIFRQGVCGWLHTKVSWVFLAVSCSDTIHKRLPALQGSWFSPRTHATLHVCCT